jgi:hypothetical protein
VPLGELAGRRLAEGEPDPRGWDVLASTGGRLGTVADLLVDVEAGEVAALALVPADADRRLSGWRDGPHVVLPMEHVELDAARRAVVPDAVGRARLYVLERDSGTARLADTPPARSAPAMGVAADAPLPPGVRTAPLPPEAEVTVERGEDGEETVRVPIVEERLVVQPVVTEVLVIRKRKVSDAQVVEADLRREKLEVHDPTRTDADADRRA